jgi:hypothetical protein
MIKKNALEELIGDKVIIFLKSTSISDTLSKNSPMGISGVAGSIVDIRDGYVFLGENTDEYDMLVDIEDIGVIRLITQEDIEAALVDLGEILPDGDIH